MGFKRIGLAFAALVVIGLGAIGVSSFLISTDTAREAVKAQIHAATGLDPIIQGGASVSPFPPDTATLRDVALEDAQHAPMLTAASSGRTLAAFAIADRPHRGRRHIA